MGISYLGASVRPSSANDIIACEHPTEMVRVLGRSDQRRGLGSRQAMRELADASVVAGETGAAPLAGLRALLSDTSVIDQLSDLGDKTALIVVTEGATDPTSYRRVVGRGIDNIGRVETAVP